MSNTYRFGYEVKFADGSIVTNDSPFATKEEAQMGLNYVLEFFSENYPSLEVARHKLTIMS